MRLALRLHPDSQCTAVTGIGVDAVRPRPGTLALRYAVTGRTGDLYLPPVTAPARTDELWRHTCFETFVCVPTGDAYYEFNFAPSTQWAAYRFNGYRQGMRIAAEVGAPRIEIHTQPERCEVSVSLELDRLPDLPGNAPWRLGLSAVIEETDGRKSYWALAHPPGRPDFHHMHGFVHELPVAETP